MNIEKEYVDGLLRKIERLQAERDALAAFVERVRRANEAQKFCHIDLLDVELSKTPQQCLRDVQAEAVLKFAKYIEETGELNFGDSNFILSEAFNYSESLRQGGAE